MLGECNLIILAVSWSLKHQIVLNFLILIYFSLSGSTPFFKDKHGKTMEDQIKTGDYSMHSKEWEGVSDGAKLIIKKMMTVNPSVRITIDELLEDPWLKVINHSGAYFMKFELLVSKVLVFKVFSTKPNDILFACLSY